MGENNSDKIAQAKLEEMQGYLDGLDPKVRAVFKRKIRELYKVSDQMIAKSKQNITSRWPMPKANDSVEGNHSKQNLSKSKQI